MKITKSQLKQIIKEEMVRLTETENEPMPHEKHPSDVAIDLGSVFVPLAIRQHNAGELTLQKLEELKKAFKLINNFLNSVPRA